MLQGAIETKVTLDAQSQQERTTFSASIVSACNNDSVILDLDTLGNYVLQGTQASATAITAVVYNATTSKYDFTVDVAFAGADTVQIKESDGTYDVIEDSLGNLYKGTSNIITVS